MPVHKWCTTSARQCTRDAQSLYASVQVMHNMITKHAEVSLRLEQEVAFHRVSKFVNLIFKVGTSCAFVYLE